MPGHYNILYQHEDINTYHLLSQYDNLNDSKSEEEKKKTTDNPIKIIHIDVGPTDLGTQFLDNKGNNKAVNNESAQTNNPYNRDSSLLKETKIDIQTLAQNDSCTTHIQSRQSNCKWIIPIMVVAVILAFIVIYLFKNGIRINNNKIIL